MRLVIAICLFLSACASTPDFIGEMNENLKAYDIRKSRELAGIREMKDADERSVALRQFYATYESGRYQIYLETKAQIADHFGAQRQFTNGYISSLQTAGQAAINRTTTPNNSVTFYYYK